MSTRDTAADRMPEAFDVLVIGAGFSGMYALHRLRQQGRRVVCLEAGDGVGGTWYWNRYPGARVDIESMQYSYSFDEDLQQEWSWSEHFSPQPDLEAYANHVADRFGLRESIRFGSRVDELTFDDAEDEWYVGTAAGDRFSAKYVIAATGSLDVSNVPDWPGLDSFGGEAYHTSRWPREGVDLAGKRVGLIGTGSTGIQLTPEVAAVAEHLTVFQRTPNFSLPSFNREIDPAYEEDWKANYPERRQEILKTHGAVLMQNVTDPRSIFDYTEEERADVMERAWNARNGLEFIRTFTDTSRDPEANAILAEFVRNKIRAIVDDPETAELLCPKTYPIGGKRICIDSGYYQTFNRDNVTLVDVRSHPIEQVTETGLRTTESEYELDALIFATGFDAMTGSLLRMNPTGADGVRLADRWAHGPRTVFGLLTAGFPNLFMVHGPGSPSVLAQMITTGEWQVDWILSTIDQLEADNVSRFAATTAQEDEWAAEVEDAASHTMHAKTDSWYTGANIPGKPRALLMYVGGFQRYAESCTRAVDQGFAGFEKRHKVSVP
ncbi:flavin-containing monooxygenase [Gordonia rubripertincta]|uniref:flavin-containing monooxygenase n=1 Tax=Gordonia rubripertincta TaxID=36822 RepID=UPI0015FBA08E|nr:NAD(P)/FAD-dependent oxidoreductase [Gordonia rubripertincta]QMU21018.1 NAD(P)/FAD-dependent oxidoreductase [Gordonia rubripertincta]